MIWARYAVVASEDRSGTLHEAACAVGERWHDDEDSAIAEALTVDGSLEVEVLEYQIRTDDEPDATEWDALLYSGRQPARRIEVTS